MHIIFQGSSLALGTYDEIINTGIDYAKLLKEDEDTKSETSNTHDGEHQRLSAQRSVSREVSMNQSRL